MLNAFASLKCSEKNASITTKAYRGVFMLSVYLCIKAHIAESSAIVCDHMETHFCDRLRSCDRDRRRSQNMGGHHRQN